MKPALRTLILLTILVTCRAQSLDSLPPYQPDLTVSGAIRVWGSAQMLALVEHWQRGFTRHHPDIRFENHLYGAASAIAGLYTGVADLAVSREIWPIETLAFEQVLGHKPAAIEVATGSFDVPTKSDSLNIFVHKENPLSRLTLAQLHSIFGSRHLPVWGELGLQGEWTNQPIHAYGYKLDNAGMMLFADIVMKGSPRWSCSLTGFANETGPGGARIDAGRLILEALSKDPHGIAISNLHYARPEVKVLSIAARDGGPYIAPSRETVRDRTYPLTRRVYIFLNQPPRRAPDPKIREFVRYVLSRDGRQDVAAEGDYLPLPAQVAVEQLKALADDRR